ncbi:MAG: hypothetical protein V7742_14060 [Halioglobus sp.]
MKYQFENCIELALEQVESWSDDLTPEQFSQAVNDQARLMAGIDLEVRDASLAVQLHATLRF